MATGRSDEESGAKRHGAPAGSGNRLRTARSAYLRQHGDNPVDWYPWGEEALRRAREEDRPVFLSIGYASCHWCHVMEREVFEDPQVAEVLNRWFVSIKVDREERPDLDAAYMDAVVAMTGSGGWPSSGTSSSSRPPRWGRRCSRWTPARRGRSLPSCSGRPRPLPSGASTPAGGGSPGG